MLSLKIKIKNKNNNLIINVDKGYDGQNGHLKKKDTIIILGKIPFKNEIKIIHTKANEDFTIK